MQCSTEPWNFAIEKHIFILVLWNNKVDTINAKVDVEIPVYDPFSMLRLNRRSTV